MLAVRRFCLGSSLLVLCAVSCDRSQSLEPAIQAASTGTAGPPVNAASNPNAVAVSESRIDIAWQDNSSNETGFEVHRSTTGPAGTFTLRASTGAGVTSFYDAGLTHSTQYCYKVRAFRITGRKTSYSEFSTTACATTPAPPPPAAPSGADATPSGSTTVRVGWWDNSTNEDGFRIERSLDAGASWTIAGTDGPNSTGFFYDIGRTSEQQVCYRVIAFNAGGDSPPSNTDCTTPPAAPTSLTVAAVDQATVELTWTDNSAVEDGYEVWTADPCCVLLDLLPANSTSYRFSGNGSYGTDDPYLVSYFVQATKDGGYSDGSNIGAPPPRP